MANSGADFSPTQMESVLGSNRYVSEPQTGASLSKSTYKSPKIQNKVSEVYNIFKQYLQGNETFRTRAERAQRMYDGDHYDPEQQATLVQRGQAPVVFNIYQDKVAALQGHLMSKPMLFSFQAGPHQSNEKAFLVNELAMRDRDLGEWSFKDGEFVKDYIINTGVLVMDISRTGDPLGHINMFKKPLASVLFDPDWTTNDEEDNDRIFIMDWMSPVVMGDRWGEDKVSGLKQAIDNYERNRINPFNSDEIICGFDRSPEFLDNSTGKYLVIHELKLVTKSYTRKVNKNTGAFFDDQPEDVQSLIQQAIESGLTQDWIDIPGEYKELQSLIFCPALSLTDELYDAPHSIQIEKYPLVISSSINSNGRRSGAVDNLIDANKLYNKTQSMWLNWQQSAISGVEFIKSESFINDNEADRYKEEGNVPGSIFFFKPSTKVEDYPKSKERPNKPSDLMDTMNNAVSYMDRVGLPPASLGLGEGAGESGVLFQSKARQGQVKQIGFASGLTRAQRRLGDLYIRMVPDAYGDGISRAWSAKDGKVIEANTTESNQLSEIGRMSVVVVDGPASDSVKETQIALLFQLKQTQTDPLMQATLDYMSADSIPGVNDETRELYKKNAQLVMDMNKSTYALKYVQSDTQLKQTIMQTQAQQAPAQGPGTMGQMQQVIAGQPQGRVQSPGAGIAPPSDAGVSG